jgi:hypothetical protein
MNESCVGGARREIARTGSDPDSAAMQTRAASYCGCVIAAFQQEYRPDEFVRLASDPGQLDKE